MFYKLMYRRSLQTYRKSYLNILCVFILSLSMLSFITIYCDSYYNYDDAVLIPMLTADHTCDIRVKNITKEEARLFADIPYVETQYINGSLDFFLTETSQFENVHRSIAKIFNAYLFDDTYTDTSPAINVFYGRDVRDKMESDNGARFGSILFQTLLSAIGIVAMVLIYSDYISERTEDIRTLSGIGISERQLRRLFSGECNVLYLLAVLIGFPLGGVIAYLFFAVCMAVDMSKSNAIYPVFDIDFLSLLLTALAGYLVIYITFRIVLGKILKIDASYTCAETVTEFDPDKSRAFYGRADRHFDIFFSDVLQKRSARKCKLLIVLIACVIALFVFMLNAINYSASIGNSHGEKDAAAAAAVFSNGSLFIMIIVYALAYSLSIIRVFTKRQTEAYADAVQILYAIGADEYTVYACFRRLTAKRSAVSVLSGFAAGYAATVLIFSALHYAFTVNWWFIPANIALAAVYYLVYTGSMKKYFLKNCRIRGFEEEAHGTA